MVGLSYYLITYQDHTSQDHFCSVIDEFPVWNSEPDQPTMMSRAAGPECEEVLELSLEVRHIDDRSSLIFLSQEDGGTWCCLSGLFLFRNTSSNFDLILMCGCDTLTMTESSLVGLKSVLYLFAATEEVCWVNLSSQPNLNPPIEKVNIVNWKLSKSLT